MSIYYAFFKEDRELAAVLSKARQLPNAEIAFSYSHGAPGVEPVLVVVAESEPTLGGVTFQQIREVPEAAPTEVEATPTTPEVTGPERTTYPRVDVVDGVVSGTTQEYIVEGVTEDAEPEESAGQEPGEEPRDEGASQRATGKTATA